MATVFGKGRQRTSIQDLRFCFDSFAIPHVIHSYAHLHLKLSLISGSVIYRCLPCLFNMALGYQCQATNPDSMARGLSQGNPNREYAARSIHSDQGSSRSTVSGASIYNAARASSDTEVGDQSFKSGNRPNERLDSDLAANMAMFVSLKSTLTPSHEPWPAHCADDTAGNPKSLWRRMQLLSNHCFSDDNITTASRAARPNNSVSNSDGSDQLRRRRTLSLNDVGDSTRERKWPGNQMSPVSPVLPRYPPPVRSPTPPGFPSFGTQEAICYSAQFLGRPASNQSAQQQSRNSLNGRVPGRTGSYGETLRRFFGLSPSPAPQPNKPPTFNIGRAADGTAVQGRFPYRQSGHGMNVARRLEDHPFHRRTLLPAHYETANTDGSPSSHRGPSCPAKDEHIAAANSSRSPDSRTNHLPDSQSHMPPGLLPSMPKQAVTARPRPVSPTSIFSLPRRLSQTIGASQSHPAQHGALARGDGSTSPDPHTTDGPSDSALTQSQPRIPETMQPRRLSIERLEEDEEEHRSFWETIRSCFCCQQRDENDHGVSTALQPTSFAYTQEDSRINSSINNHNPPSENVAERHSPSSRSWHRMHGVPFDSDVGVC